jgi:hypothetical protein
MMSENTLWSCFNMGNKLAYLVLARSSFGPPAKNGYIEFEAVFLNDTNYNCYCIYIELTVGLGE